MNYDRICRIADENREGITELLRALVRIPSLSKNEARIAEFVADKMRQMNLDVKCVEAEKGRPNVIGRLRGSVGKPVLVMNSHMDTVPPGSREKWSVDPFSAEVRDGRVFGLGATDNKGALTAMIMTACLIQKAGIKLKGDLLLTAVVDEELGGHKGAEYLVNQGLAKGDAVLVCGVSDNLEKIFIAGKGRLVVEVTAKGRSSHAAFPELGINAVDKMADLIVALRKLDLEYKPHRLLGHPTIAHATTIVGGTRTNSIPDVCKATWDIRLVPGQTRDQILNVFQKAIEKLQLVDHSFEAELNVLDYDEPIELSENEKIVTIASRAAKKVLGRNPQLAGLSGVTDARYFARKGGIPTIYNYGPGLLDGCHIPDESMEIEAVVKAVKVFAITASEFCGHEN